MFTKTKIRDFANDLGMDSKEITAILKKYAPGNRSVQSALSEEEADYLLAVITQSRAVENLDAYFSMKKP